MNLKHLKIKTAAEYQGKDVELDKPTDGDVKKYKVYVKNDKGNVVKVNFGDPNMEIKRDDPERRKNFRARHNCDNPGPKDKARFWSCKMWSDTPVSDIVSCNLRDLKKTAFDTDMSIQEIVAKYIDGSLSMNQVRQLIRRIYGVKDSKQIQDIFKSEFNRQNPEFKNWGTAFNIRDLKKSASQKIAYRMTGIQRTFFDNVVSQVIENVLMEEGKAVGVADAATYAAKLAENANDSWKEAFFNAAPQRAKAAILSLGQGKIDYETAVSQIDQRQVEKNLRPLAIALVKQNWDSLMQQTGRAPNIQDEWTKQYQRREEQKPVQNDDWMNQYGGSINLRALKKIAQTRLSDEEIEESFKDAPVVKSKNLEMIGGKARIDVLADGYVRVLVFNDTYMSRQVHGFQPKVSYSSTPIVEDPENFEFTPEWMDEWNIDYVVGSALQDSYRDVSKTPEEIEKM